ncbi:O-antigen ligase family protein [Crenobacter cavernae]|uniref:O-antigen ligase-related domain-containing protein n=1 Tax=Crenobacter cavernae TaxID=2290923 RepID=A0ABY0FFM0_9NEIS|nr:O-antigen ligase family protein [Crenobacter cavernae]RXZ43735.1 hypothetical protein EBB06_09010 [Crenobacter cavernae]
MFTSRNEIASAGWLTVLAGVFLALSNIPHTVAFRYSALAVFLFVVFRSRRTLADFVHKNRFPVVAFLSFVCFGLLHSIFLSAWPEASLGEFRSQVLVGAGFFLAGGTVFTRRRELSVVDLIVCAVVSVAALELLYALYHYYASGSLPYMVTATTETKLEYTFFVNLGLTVLGVSLVVGNWLGFGRLCRWPAWAQGLAFLLLITTSLWAGARNGLIGMVYLFGSLLAVYVLVGIKNKQAIKAILAGAAVVMTLSGMVSYAVEKDARWQRFWGSAEAGFNYEDSRGWRLQAHYPLLEDGQPVDPSAYERIAWISKGADLILQNPLGFGYARDAFGRTLKQEYRDSVVAHSHSGFVDLGVGLGWGGLILWLLFLGGLVWRGLSAFFRHREPLGLVLALLATGYFGRMLIESVNKDHMLHIFLFLVAAVMAELARREGERSSA